jgi:hypothetical protein
VPEAQPASVAGVQAVAQTLLLQVKLPQDVVIATQVPSEHS